MPSAFWMASGNWPPFGRERSLALDTRIVSIPVFVIGASGLGFAGVGVVDRLGMVGVVLRLWWADDDPSSFISVE